MYKERGEWHQNMNYVIIHILQKEMDLGEFDRDTVLEEVETWDSVAVLSFIAFMNEKFDKIFHASEIAVCKTVGDLMDMMHV